MNIYSKVNHAYKTFPNQLVNNVLGTVSDYENCDRFEINQKTPNISLTIPAPIISPINTRNIITITNIGIVPITINGLILAANFGISEQFYNGTKWVQISSNNPINDQPTIKYVDIGQVRIQWGIGNTSAISLITLPVPFLNNTYSITCTISQNIGTVVAIVPSTFNKTTTNFETFFAQLNNKSSVITTATGQSFDWLAIGVKP